MMDTVTISKEDLADVVREAVRSELHAVGLRADQPDAVDKAREDFRFLRRLREAVEGAASKIGMAVLLAIAGCLVSAVGFGLKAMLTR